MAQLKKWIFLPVLFLAACAMYEHEIEQGGHRWFFEGIKDDSTAVVRVEYWESGTIHDHSIMGLDDDFSNQELTEYFAVGMKGYRRSGSYSSKNALLGDSVTRPEWCDSCLVVGKLGDKVYGIRSASLDSYSYSCALILLDEKSYLDSLEFETCSGVDDSRKLALQGNYLKVDDKLYRVEEGKFPTQRPAYKVEHKDGAIKFTDSNGNYIIYGGNP